jgi:hypothetical protein
MADRRAFAPIGEDGLTLREILEGLFRGPLSAKTRATMGEAGATEESRTHSIANAPKRKGPEARDLGG